jgi:Fic family protein
MKRLELLRPLYFDDYQKKQPITLLKHFNKIKKQPLNFGYALENSVVFSSMIEGNRIDIDTYLKYFHSGMNTKSKSYLEIEDLKQAYIFAKSNKISLPNLLKAHKLISKRVLDDKKYIGKIRDREVYIFSQGVKIYTGASAEIVKKEVKKLLSDIEILTNRDLSISEVFYYASYIHLMFAKIHPFADGNGRTARLLEKWFLAQKLGLSAWDIQSEKMYQKRLKQYYTNIHIGENYEDLNFNLINPFLLMLPIALRTK